MRLLISLITPWPTLFTTGNPIAENICLVVQIAVIGWLMDSLFTKQIQDLQEIKKVAFLKASALRKATG